MNREIKYRGRDICTGEWVYGDLRQRVGCLPSIIHTFCNKGKLDYCETPIHRVSLGQSTGLYDINEKEIFEGDIVEWCFFYFETEILHKGVIEWHQGGFAFNVIDNYRHDVGWYGISDLNTDTESDVRVVGNIHDNLDLISNYVPIEDQLKRLYSEIPEEDRNTDAVLNL